MVKKALLIGINYTGHSAGVLRGCHNDCLNMKTYICSEQGYNDNNIVLLMDQPGTPASGMPTRANITNAMKWLMKDARAGDSLFLHYSGHGGQVADTDGDEEDGMDETLVPLDYQSAGQITDDELHLLLVAPMPEGVKMTCVFDCCHSGTILDLPYVYKPGQGGQGVALKKWDFSQMKSEALRMASHLQRTDVSQTEKAAAAQSFLAGCCSFLSSTVGMGGPETQPLTGGGDLARAGHKKGGQIVLITGCKDEQTSADATINNAASGALTWGLLKVLKERRSQVTHEELLVDTRKALDGKYTQIPQFCMGKETDLKTPFSF